MTSLSEQDPERDRVLSRRNPAHRSTMANDLLKLGHRAFPFLFALAYAGVLTSLPIDAFKDRHNYLLYAEVSDAVLAGYISRGWHVVLANEPLWRLINIGLDHFLDAEQIVRILIFIPAFIVPYVVLKNNPKHSVWLVFFLLIPQVMKFHVIQLRQGFGIAVFLAGYYARPKWLRLVLMGAAGFVHSSLLVVSVIGAISSAFRMLRVSPRLRIFLFIFIFAILGFSLQIIAASLGARQGERYLGVDYAISGLGFVFWTSIFLLYITSGRRYLLENLFPIAGLTFYLPSYFATPVAARIFESVILLVLIAGLSLIGWRRQVFLAAVTFYAVFMYWQRLDQPWLGWGVS